MPQPQGRWLRNADHGSAVVFVHGFLSDGESCWANDNAYWPQLVADSPAAASIGVYVFSYRTEVFSGGYSLGDIVDALKAYLDLDGLLKLRRLIFVCHSMGGIIARQFIVINQADFTDRKTCLGLFLVASPSIGSDYATLFGSIAHLLTHAQAQILRFAEDNQWLNDLDHNFINLKESKRFPLFGKELVEDRFVFLPALIKKPVVARYSAARYFGDSVKIPGSNHFDIAKPTDPSALQHRLLLQFLAQVVEGSPETRSTVPSSPKRRSALEHFKNAHDKVHSMYLICDDFQSLLDAGSFSILKNTLRSHLRSLTSGSEDLTMFLRLEHFDYSKSLLADIDLGTKQMASAFEDGDIPALLFASDDLLHALGANLSRLAGQIDQATQDLYESDDLSFSSSSNNRADLLAQIQVAVDQHTCWQRIDSHSFSIRRVIIAKGIDISRDWHALLNMVNAPRARRPFVPSAELDAALAAASAAVNKPTSAESIETVKEVTFLVRDIFFQVDRNLRNLLGQAIPQLEQFLRHS